MPPCLTVAFQPLLIRSRAAFFTSFPSRVVIIVLDDHVDQRFGDWLATHGSVFVSLTRLNPLSSLKTPNPYFLGLQNPSSAEFFDEGSQSRNSKNSKSCCPTYL
ncbi:hypothetical protein GYMLUDRAFT_904454 [Collybiopsis luxurians FD-317 M1]|uniref:Uncharacterized protein n=1 Tax=Collybiopsis luxurians FD-317 M1 TaxID=944289 RepID=A0A0D0BI03_9AGAR|nr:hypothetical protein GYMLUDRAFT_904454 [Collybiopsis luxurians FD-317 M1]